VIDIVIPAHRGGHRFEQALASVLNQSNPDWSLYVLDDASEGTSVRDAVTMAADPRVSYERNPERLGINGQFNKALATGDSAYVVIMGDDDELLPHYVEQMTASINRFPEAAIHQPGVEVIDAEGLRSRPLGDRVKAWLSFKPDEPTVFGGEPLITSILRGNWAYFPSICWKRSAARAIGFRPEYDVVLDLALIVELLRQGGSMAIDPRVAFRYRRHGSSLSSAWAADGRRFSEERAYFATAAQQLTESGMPRAARAARVHLTSRLHALTRLPAAVRSRDLAATRALARHAARWSVDHE
jgi:glycosyltransferase involved in cell wall biosynthesis